MGNIQNLIDEIENKVIILVDKIQKLEAENTRLLQENSTLLEEKQDLLNKIENLGTGVEGGFIQTDKFKSTLLSFCFFIKNSEKTASFALFSEISTNVCDEYPTIRELKKKLDELFGIENNKKLVG